jgi:hypothetical protein
MPSSTSTGNQQSDVPELGYVLLENCIVNIIQPEKQHALSSENDDPKRAILQQSPSKAAMPLKEWIDVTVHYMDGCSEKLVTRNINAESNGFNCQQTRHLTFCLAESATDTSTQQPCLLECILDDYYVPFFSGYVNNQIKPKRKLCHDERSVESYVTENEANNISNKSDSILLLGLLRSVYPVCQAQSLCVLLHEPTGTDCVSYTASLYVTLSFPFLSGMDSLPTDNNPMWRRSILPSGVKNGGRNQKKRPMTSLPMQALFSIIQSDWNVFHRRKQELENPLPSHDFRLTATSLFPPSVTMNELYKRIDYSSVERQSDSCDGREKNTLKYKAGLLVIPLEILTQRLGPFLRALELDALRCTCSCLHNAFRAVVPGMKLKLYKHQIESLAWMRTRETRCLREIDCLNNEQRTDAFSPSDTDIHRSVSGGSTCLLKPNHTPLRPLASSNRDATPIRIDQQTGLEVLDDDFRYNRFRFVARGGLLCDDPGLGKTITVLSLILQTTGLVASDNLLKRFAESNTELINDETVFAEYWRAGMTADFRRVALTSIVNCVCRCLSPEFGPQTWDIRTKIERDAYSDSFQRFEADMRYV